MIKLRKLQHILSCNYCLKNAISTFSKVDGSANVLIKK